MMRAITLILALILIPNFASGLTPEAKQKVARMEAGRLADVRTPAVTRHTLSNGMRCYILEDHELPIVQASLLIRAGRVAEDAGKIGVGVAMADLLRNGGTLRRSAAEIDSILDQKAIDIGFSISNRMATGAMGALSKNMDEAFSFFFEMLFSPAFDPKRLEVTKGQIIEGIERRNDTPEQISDRLFRSLIYGEDSPWGRSATIKTIRNIQQADVKSFHEKYYAPNQMILAVAGDINARKLIALLEDLLKNVPSRDVQFAEPPVRAEFEPVVAFVKKRSTQASISLGHLSTSRDNPDKYAIRVMDDILGGGSFRSRLKSKIRNEKGLAYEVWSDFAFGSDAAPAYFEVHAKTMNEKAADTIELAMAELKRLHDNGDVTDAEVSFAKDAILNRFVFEYASKFNIVSNIANFIYWGYPENYMEIYKRKVGEVGREDVANVARKYLHPDGTKILVVGDGGQLEKRLSKMGKVKRLKYD